MAKSIEQQVAGLRTTESVDELRKALRSGKGMVVAVAAARAAALRLDALAPDLAAAFELDKKADPMCRGKLAIAKALHELDEWDDRVFEAGLRVVQIEGYDPVDTAGTLRGACGIAHVHFGKSNALDVLAMLLADDDRNCRLAAAQGIGDSGRADATALLRFKLLATDENEPEVLAVCFESLFALAREASADFAIEMLAQNDDRSEAAALALGSMRIARAAKPLAAWAEQCRPERRHRVAYVALALLRDDLANETLCDVIRTQPRDALAAAKALATFKNDAAVVAAVREAARDLDGDVRAEIESILAPG